MSSVFAAMFAGLIASTAMGQAGISLPMKVDHRGLIEIPGVLRQASGSHWGAANLVVFGPSWGYAAQDYAMTNIQRTGQGSDVTVTGDLSVPGAKVQVCQTTRSVTSDDGRSKLHVTWTIRSPEKGKPLNLQKAYVFFPFAVSDYAGRTLAGSGGASAVFPAECHGESIGFPRDVSSVVLKGDSTTFGLEGKNLNLAVVDGRQQKAENYQLRLEFQNVKDADSATIEFEVWAETPAFTIQAGDDCLTNWRNRCLRGRRFRSPIS